MRFIAIISCLLLLCDSHAQEGLPFPSLSTLAAIKKIEPLIHNFDPLNESDVDFLTNQVDTLYEKHHKSFLHALLLYNTSQIDKLFYNVLNIEVFASQESVDEQGKMEPLRVAALPRSSYLVIGKYGDHVMNLIHMITPLEIPTKQENDVTVFDFTRDPSAVTSLIPLPEGKLLRNILGLAERRVICVYEDSISHEQNAGIWDVQNKKHLYDVISDIDMIERIDAQTFLTVSDDIISIWKVPTVDSTRVTIIPHPSATIDISKYNDEIQQILPMTDTSFVVAFKKGKILLCDIAGNIRNDVIDTNFKHPEVKRVNDTTIAAKAADGRVLKLWDVTLRRKAPAASEVNITEYITSFFVIDEQRIFVQRGPLYRIYSYEKGNKGLTRLFQFGHPDDLANVIKSITKIADNVLLTLYTDGIVGIFVMNSNNPYFFKVYEPSNPNFSNVYYPVALLQYPTRWLLFGNVDHNDVIYERDYYFYELKTLSQWIFAYIIGHAGIYQRQWTQAQKEKLIALFKKIFIKQFELVANDPLTIGYQIWNYIQSIVPITQPAFVPPVQSTSASKHERDQEGDIDKGKEPMTEDEEREYERESQIKRRRLGEQ